MAVQVIRIAEVLGIVVEQAEHARERRISRGRADLQIDPGGIVQLEMVPGDVRGPVGPVADRARRLDRLAERAEVLGLVDGLVGLDHQRRGAREPADFEGFDGQLERLDDATPAAAAGRIALPPA